MRTVLSGELEDGHADLELPEHLPDRGLDEMFELEVKSIETEFHREIVVPVSAESVDLKKMEKLSTSFMIDWRWRKNNQWQRRSRLVARDHFFCSKRCLT